MKKALSIVLSLLVIFSVFSCVAVAASDATVTVQFVSDGKILKTDTLHAGDAIIAPANPSKAATEEKEFTFVGWTEDENGEGKVYQASNLGLVPADLADGTVITYYAKFAEDEVVVRQTFWNFIESLFERINLLFEYFAAVFGF